jgi:hypothetical protein
MWWKLGGLIVVTLAAAISLIPIRTHAVLLDPDKPPPRSVRTMIANIYLTRGAVIAILTVLCVAGFVAFKVVRGDW